MLVVLLLSALYLAEGGLVFMGFKEQVDYDTATSRCASYTFTGNLAVWGSWSEYNRIRTAKLGATGGTPADFWVGLDDKDDENGVNEGYWRFVDGNTGYCDDFINGPTINDCDNLPQWADGQPDDGGDARDEDCAIINTDGKVSDEDCSSNVAGYVCRFEPTINVGVSQSTEPFINIPPVSNPNYYIFEFTSGKDMVTLISIILNVTLITLICYVIGRKRTHSSHYSTVKMYDSEDQQLK
eukprot:442102_1